MSIRNELHIDSSHCRAICEEIGWRLRATLARETPAMPLHLQLLMDRLAEQELVSFSIVPSMDDLSSFRESQVYDLVLGQVVMRLRERHGFTQGQLAEQVGLTQTTLSRIERGQARPDPFVLRRIAETFGMTGAAFSQSVDSAFQRTQQAAQSTVHTEADQSWWVVALGVAGFAGLLGLSAFAVAVKITLYAVMNAVDPAGGVGGVTVGNLDGAV